MVLCKRNILCILLIILGVTLHSQTGLTEVKDFGKNPGNLLLFIHPPKVIKANMPLVVALHGCNEDPATIAKQSDWNRLADENGFMVIYPQQRFFNNPSYCFSWYNENDIKKNSGESGSIKEMIDFVCDSFHIDRSKIFAYGLSAGAVMTSALLADYPETFNTGAILAGAPFYPTGVMNAMSGMVNPKHKSSKEWGEAILKQNPGYTGKYPRVIILHGKKDVVVDPQNSYELIKQWAYVLHTDTVPSKTVTKFAGNKDVERESYLNRQKEEKIIFYSMSGLGHALPVDPGTGATQGGATGLFAVDKDFFSTYWIAKDFGLVK
ncbi:MAG: extracellular catalytic domain type 1 short-chain-length polyhydroxyalkanoate depolymerase [Bacteroidia bacterium]